jgi:hypothetical protein
MFRVLTFLLFPKCFRKYRLLSSQNLTKLCAHVRHSYIRHVTKNIFSLTSIPCINRSAINHIFMLAHDFASSPPISRNKNKHGFPARTHKACFPVS